MTKRRTTSLLLAAISCTFGQNAQASPPRSPFGVSTSAEASGEYAKYLPKLQAIGARTLRGFGEWEGLQPTPESFELGDEDRRIAALKAHGLTPSGLFLYGARWASPDAASPGKTFPIARLDAWQRYVAALVHHYRDSISHWEVWNEPNAPVFNQGNHSPADYARLVRASYSAAKRARRGVQIGIGCANFDVRYLRLVLEALKQQGAPNAFDFVAVHPYDLLLMLREPDGEPQFLSIAGNLRSMLGSAAPAKRDVPIQFTELGVQLRSDRGAAAIGEQEAAVLLIKAYALSLAQGIAQVHWFEVKDAGGSRGFGLLNDDMSERTAYRAYGALTDTLGENPVYQGWLPLGAAHSGYGFVFSAGKTAVLIAWMPPGQSETLRFDAGLKVVDIFTRGASALAANTDHVLTDKPVLFEQLPASLVRVAQANRARPFPWHSPAQNRQLATLELGPRNVSRGLRQVSASSTEPHSFSDGSTGVKLNVGRGNTLYLAADPEFANYQTRDVYVRVTARTTGPNPKGRSSGMNLWYQPYTGSAQEAPQYPYRAAASWWTVPDDGAWHTNTWHLSDAMFVHTFGFSLYLQVDDSVPFAVGKVELSRQPFD